MLDLGAIRHDIDEVDEAIVKLFEKRMQLTGEVAAYKIETGKPVFDQKREVEKLSCLREKASNDFNAIGVQELFQQIMSISRKRQYQLLTEKGIAYPHAFQKIDDLQAANQRIVFQGVEGAYSHGAMKAFFGDDVQGTNVKTWKKAMQMVVDGKADYAVLPIENSTAGSVTDIYDLMLEYPVVIVGEQIIRIDHTLMGVKGASLDDIHIVYSHPQALAQCKVFLEQHPEWKQEAMLNTAMAAEKVAEDGLKNQAAIASRYAAEHFSLNLLVEEGLALNSNETRFIIISGEKKYLKSANKMSICIELPHESGSLYNILSHIIYNHLNMTRIKSRPIKGKNWEYRFFIDFEGNMDDPAVVNAIRGIEAEASMLKILGNY